jgi:transposase
MGLPLIERVDYRNTTPENLPGADRKIAFDKFHVAKYLGEAVDKV